MAKRTLFEKIFGYCRACDRWFCPGVRRRPFNAEYADEGCNHITVCRECYDEIQDVIETMEKREKLLRRVQNDIYSI